MGASINGGTPSIPELSSICRWIFHEINHPSIGDPSMESSNDPGMRLLADGLLPHRFWWILTCTITFGMYAKLLARQCRKIMENHEKSCFFQDWVYIPSLFPLWCSIKKCQGPAGYRTCLQGWKSAGGVEKVKDQIEQTCLGIWSDASMWVLRPDFSALTQRCRFISCGQVHCWHFQLCLCCFMQRYAKPPPFTLNRYATLFQYIIVSAAVFVQFPNRNPGQYQQYSQIKTHGPHYNIYIYTHIHMLQCDYCDLFCHVPSC